MTEQKRSESRNGEQLIEWLRDYYDETDGEWQAGIAGNCNLVAYNGEDIVGIGTVHSESRLKYIADLRNMVPEIIAALSARSEIDPTGPVLEGAPPTDFKKLYSEWCRYARKLEKEIESLRSAIAAPRWYPVVIDSLPKFYGTVLAVIRGTTTATCVEAASLRALCSDAIRNDEQCVYSHWMPMPEAPRE
jgi:hypothetical protein